MPDINNHRRPGDRKEGRRIRTISPYMGITPFIMAKRNDATNFFEDTIETTETDHWFRKQRAEGYKGIGFLHLFVAAYVRTVAHCPALNRFCSGQRIYSRDKIEVVMTVKKELSSSAGETSAKFEFEPTDTIFDVYRKMNSQIDDIKADDESNGTEATASLFMKIPRLLLRFAIWLLGVLDYFGIMPRAIERVSPFHGSMIITDLGSIGIPAIYHHIYNFGNLPLFISFGTKYRRTELAKDGTLVERKYIDYKVVCDERTMDGMSYGVAFKYMKYYLLNPQQLEIPPAEVKEDIP